MSAAKVCLLHIEFILHGKLFLWIVTSLINALIKVDNFSAQSSLNSGNACGSIDPVETRVLAFV